MSEMAANLVDDDQEDSARSQSLPTGAILLAATPIGNPADASERLREAILKADIIAAEDTRRFLGLCSRLDLRPSGRVVAFHDHNETARTTWLVEEAVSGATILVVSDAGTPTVSDPGFHLVQAAAAAGVLAVPLPGPSAALAALSVSGLPTDRFVFEGFLPRRPSEQRKRVAELASEPRTLILFESPRRTAATLELLAERFGPGRPAALCRELTKTFEEVIRGSLADLAQHAKEQEILGEVTLVVGGDTGKPAAQESTESLARQVLAMATEEGIRLKDAAGQVAERSGTRKNELMKAALELQKSGQQD